MIKIDGQDHVNPFLYFQIPEPIGSSSNSSVHEPYIKPANHTTVMYPFSGICKPDPAKKLPMRTMLQLKNSRNSQKSF